MRRGRTPKSLKASVVTPWAKVMLKKLLISSRVSLGRAGVAEAVVEVGVEAEEQVLNVTSRHSIRVEDATRSHLNPITTSAATLASVQIDKYSLIALIIRHKSMQRNTIFAKLGQTHLKAFKTSISFTRHLKKTNGDL
jgi:hypothetical protein